MRTPRQAALLMLALVAAGCSQPAAPVAQPASQPTRQATPGPKALRVTLTGQLRIPTGLSLGAGVRLVGNHGGSLVSDNGGGLLSDRGAGVVANGGASLGGGRLAGAGDATGGKLRLMAVEAAAVEGARVFLADAAGRPLPDLTEGKTDARGQFTLPQVPGEATFVVVAHVPTSLGRTAVFRTVVKLGRFGATTEIDPATTLVTASVLDGLPRGELGELNPAKFQTASEATARNLTKENLPDFTDSLAVKASIDALTAQVKELRDVLAQVRDELAALRSSIDALRKEPGAGDTTAQASQLPRQKPTPKPLAPDPSPPPAARGGCELKPYPVRFADPRVMEVSVWERRPEQSTWSDLEGVQFSEGDSRLDAPPGCPVWLVYVDEDFSVIGAVPFVFPAWQENAPPLVLPVPKPVPPRPEPSSFAPPDPTSGATCDELVKHTFALVDASEPGASNRITRAWVRSKGAAGLDAFAPTEPGAPFSVPVPEGCPLSITLFDAWDNVVAEVEVVVPRGSKGRIVNLLI
jgi:hypothetical protein